MVKRQLGRPVKKLKRRVRQKARQQVRDAKQYRRRVGRIIRRKKRRREAGIPPLGTIIAPPTEDC